MPYLSHSVVLHQLGKRLGVALAQQITGPLPPEHVAGRLAPWRAAVILVARQEAHEQRRLRELPALALAARQDVAEQLLGLLPGQEMRLVRRPLIRVARRRHDPVDAHRHDFVEEFGHALRLRPVEQRAVDAEPEPTLDFASLIAATARSNTPSWLTARSCISLIAVQMHIPREVRVGLEQIHLLLEQQRVRAQIDEFLARQDALDDLRHLLVQQRLAAGDRNHRSAAFVDRLQRIGDRQPLVQNLGRIVDLAATGASQIAAEQRLEHQHERVALPPPQMLPDHVGADLEYLPQRNRHQPAFPRPS